MDGQPWFDKAIRDHTDEHGPSGGAWNISMILERLHGAAPKPLPIDEGLVELERLKTIYTAWTREEVEAIDVIEATGCYLAAIEVMLGGR